MRAISVATATILALGGAAYAQQGAGAEPAQVIAYLDKAVEITLIVLLWIDGQRR